MKILIDQKNRLNEPEDEVEGDAQRAGGRELENLREFQRRGG